MRGDETRDFACRLNPDGEDAGVFAVRGFDLALDGEFFAVPRDLDGGHSLACSVGFQCSSKCFPCFGSETSFQEELRFRGAVFVGKIEQVGGEFTLFNEQAVGIRQVLRLDHASTISASISSASSVRTTGRFRPLTNSTS